ncbi:ABC transporter A family member 1-like isoform X2 [Halichondria panicea]
MLDSLFMGMVVNKTVTFSLNTTTFPEFYQQESIEAKQATSATLFLFCAITFQFVMMMYNVVSEKDLKLRQGLKLIGLKDSVYWMSWAITGLIIAFLSTCILMASGYACQLKFFLNTNFVINFVLFLVYSSSMVPLAFFTSVFITTVRQAVNTGMVVFVVGMFVIVIISNPFVMTLMYENVPALIIVLSFLPPFHLAKAMADIGIAGSSTDINGLPQTPHFYDWADLVERRRVQVFNFNFKPGSHTAVTYFNLPPTYQSLVFLVLNALFYGIIAWYLDAVLTGNHSIPRKWYFFLQPSYWCDCLSDAQNRLEVSDHGHSPINERVSDENDDEETNERTALMTNKRSYGVRGNEQFALRIQELVKVFNPSGCCSCCKKPNAPAVDELSLNVEENQILALLGHNGAGKTTTINMLIGLLEPDKGDAFFYNYSVRHDLDLLRSVLGVCPQHDILWGDLTAMEHMKLFAHLKNIPSEQMKEDIANLLEEVKLTKVANQRVNTYSGGMKRRLSVALSFLGDPKVLFLDEPTTGMDPKIRRDIWNLILRSKKNRVTIMTTHSMEEADILGDSIAIMANGSLKAMGTSVNLKNTYAGYGIEFIVHHDSVQNMISFITDQIPDAVLKTDPTEVEGGMRLTFGLPPNMNEAIVPLFKTIEEDPNIGRMVVDYSISQTTLEEVFFNVTVNELFKDAAYKPAHLQSQGQGHSLRPLHGASDTPPTNMKNAIPT